MKKNVFAFILLVTFGGYPLLADETNNTPTDIEIKQKLFGKWSVEIPPIIGDTNTIRGIESFSTNGLYTLQQFLNDDKIPRINIQGRWDFKGGILTRERSDATNRFNLNHIDDHEMISYWECDSRKVLWRQYRIE